MLTCFYSTACEILESNLLRQDSLSAFIKCLEMQLPNLTVQVEDRDQGLIKTQVTLFS